MQRIKEKVNKCNRIAYALARGAAQNLFQAQLPPQVIKKVVFIESEGYVEVTLINNKTYLQPIDNFEEELDRILEKSKEYFDGK